MISLRRVLLISGSAALAVVAAHAQTTLCNNLTAPINSYYRVYNQGPLYNSFSTGATGQLLNDVKVYLESAPSADFISVAVYADAGNVPGAQLRTFGTLTDSSISTTGGVYDFPG